MAPAHLRGIQVHLLGPRGHVGVSEALDYRGSSLFTLGFLRPETFWLLMVSFIEAAIGLFLLALLITYLPSIYGAVQPARGGVTALSVRAGEPPSGRELIWRYWALGRMDHLMGLAEWERWFVDVEETHTSFPALVFFRSPLPDHPGSRRPAPCSMGPRCVVDVSTSTRRAGGVLHPGGLPVPAPGGRLLQLRRMTPIPRPTTPISITRAEWEEAVALLESEGVPIKPDREQAWRDFAGWRVNYDTVLLALANLTIAPEAPWSSDRSRDQGFRLRRMGGIKPVNHAAYVRPGLNTMSRTTSTSTT